MFTEEDLAILAEEGCAGLTNPDAFVRREGVTSQQVSRTGQWVALMGGTDHLTDLLAREYFAERVALVPADDTPFNGRLAAQLCRTLARRAVMHGRAATAYWEGYAEQLTAALPTFADTFAQCWADNVQAFDRPTATQVIAASMNPQGRSSWSLKLEHAGTEAIRLLSHDKGSRPDVWVKDLGKHVSRRDPVAYSGEPRYVLPQPCRYGRNGLQPKRETALHRRYTASTTEIAVTFFPVVELLTTDYAWRNRSVVDPSNVRRGWRGHRRIVWTVQPANAGSVAKREARKARKAERQQVTSTARGPAVGPWALAPSSLRVSAEQVTEQVTTIETTLRLAAAEQVITFTGGVTVTVLSGTQVRDNTRERAYPIREWARRAALAGLTLS